MPAAATSSWSARVLAALPGSPPENETECARAIARAIGIELADLTEASPAARALVPERWARHCRILPLRATDSEIVVATADPLDLDCERTLAFATGRTVRFALAAPSDIQRALDGAYRDVPSSRADARAPAIEVQLLSNDQEVAPPGAGDDGGSTITRLVDEILGAGVAAHASDIHIEPEEQGIAVRHRVDGVLRLARTLPRGVAPSLVSRIKILSGLDIADRLRPQDGRARVAVNGAAVDLRISTLPASHGEKVVIRVLDRRSTVLSLDAMGFLPAEYERIDALLQCREGLILVTGPTGSGKTTTLYAALRRLQQRGVNIVTVEDPIEYRIPGIVQVQVNERAGLTFASALRSIMRQDPDVLLIGEIRDRETAEIAIQASLTGHLVLSTLHTNDAASAITRLADIGVAPYKIATAVKGVVAQRLVRRLCSCGAARNAAPRLAVAEPATCAECGGNGYRGRLAIVEVLTADAEFEQRVTAGEPAERLALAARNAGMRSLWDSGLAHVQAGDTTIAELLRVAAPPSAAHPRLAPLHGHAPSDAGGVSSDDAAPVDAAAPARYFRTARHAAPRSPRPGGPVFKSPVSVDVGTVEVYVIHPAPEGWRVLALQRAQDAIRPGSWEMVTGSIEGHERPEDAATREVREETGLAIDRLYCVAVQPFYLPRRSSIQMSVVFAAFVDQPGAVALSAEHQRSEWLSVEDARERVTWPRARRTLDDIARLLGPDTIGMVDDVLRVR